MTIISVDIEVETGSGISVHDLMPKLAETLKASRIRNGLVSVTAQHTTTAIFINEHEERLLDDLRRFLTRLIPPQDVYLHNDIALRNCPPEEPENAHSHLAAILLASSQTIPLADGKLALGQYQSVMLCELDGPRRRTVRVHVFGE